MFVRTMSQIIANPKDYRLVVWREVGGRFDGLLEVVNKEDRGELTSILERRYPGAKEGKY